MDVVLHVDLFCDNEGRVKRVSIFYRDRRKQFKFKSLGCNPCQLDETCEDSRVAGPYGDGNDFFPEKPDETKYHDPSYIYKWKIKTIFTLIVSIKYFDGKA